MQVQRWYMMHIHTPESYEVANDAENPERRKGGKEMSQMEGGDRVS